MNGIVRRIFLALACAATTLAASAQPLDELVFATDWLAQAEHGGFYQAVAEGIYRKHGLDVTIRMGGPQVNGLQLLAAGQLDVVMGDALQVLSAVEQSVPVTAIAATFQKNPTVIIAHPGVAKLEDLKGKPIAVARGEQHDVLALAQAALRLHRRPEASVRVQRAAVSRRQEPVAAGLRDVRAVLDRERRREAGGVPARRAGLSALLRSARRAARCARANVPMR